MNYLKKNKFMIIAVIIFILIIIFGAELKKVLVPDEGKASYGNRLDGIENYPIDSKIFEEMEKSLKENYKIISISNKLHGKIINLIITVNDDVSLDSAKKMANSTISFFNNKELEFYSLNVYVKKENSELNNFPIEGYKDPDSKELIFTKDREIVKGDNNE